MSFSNTDTGAKNADPYKEKNKDETSIKEKVDDLSEFISACKFGMMTTRDAASGALVSRCMALAAKVFHLPIHTTLNDFPFFPYCTLLTHPSIDSDPHTNISFLNSSGEWASVSGISSIITDRAVVKKYYSPALKAWLGDLGDGKHNGGPDDPRIGIIKVETKTASYAVSRRSTVGGMTEVAKGVVTGKAPSVNKLRELSESEIGTWRTSNGMVQ
ncbi:hypothetical protein B7494_g627 [Chlorociboria aeruginascens]|nr:hypothetical protein B7494_g627 [Chlorociboria aeruginascens]